MFDQHRVLCKLPIKQIIAFDELDRKIGTIKRLKCFFCLHVPTALWLACDPKECGIMQLHRSRVGVGSTGIVRVAEGKKLRSPPPRGQLSGELRNADSERDIGSALRAAYDSAVQEEIPPAMLDLLNKLR